MKISPRHARVAGFAFGVTTAPAVTAEPPSSEAVLNT